MTHLVKQRDRNKKKKRF